MADLPLLLLCGIGGDADSWRDQQSTLAVGRECRTIVAAGGSIAAMADTVLADAPPRFALSGHSLGGYVALAMARAAPERIERLALVNSSARPDTAEQSEGRRKLLLLAERDGYDGVAERLTHVVSAGDPMLRERYLAMLLRTGHARFVRDQSAAMTRPDARPGLDAIACPTLVIGSAADPIVAPEASEEMAARIASARLVMIESASHAAPMAAPIAVTASLRDWLDA
ncbi:MAG: alpha/beta fold hydrolase [Sphingobium sp.]